MRLQAVSEAMQCGVTECNVFVTKLRSVIVGIGKFMHQAVLYTTDAVSAAFEYVKNLGAELAENTYIKNLATNTIARYENFLADMIEELKNHLEDLRESMLQSFPQQEAQEFLLALFEYAEKKARGTPVDDAAMREQIYNKFVAAVRKAGKDLYTFDLENGLILAQVCQFYISLPWFALRRVDAVLRFCSCCYNP